MAAKFVTRTITQGSQSFLARYFECAPSDIKIINNNTVSPANNWSKYGTNASFFDQQGVMSAIHVSNNQAVRDGGFTNCAKQGLASSAMDYMYYTTYNGGSPSVNIQAKAASFAAPPVNSPLVYVWAVGGFDLLMGGAYNNEAELKTAINNHFGNSTMVDSYVPFYPFARQRTAIGYKNGNVMFGGFVLSSNDTSGPTVFEMHKIMKGLGCSMALLLDGSGSTQIKYKSSNGTNLAFIGDKRNVWCEISLTDTAANGCNWAATT